jgi:hypothetical protein
MVGPFYVYPLPAGRTLLWASQIRTNSRQYELPLPLIPTVVHTAAWLTSLHIFVLILRHLYNFVVVARNLFY